MASNEMMVFLSVNLSMDNSLVRDSHRASSRSISLLSLSSAVLWRTDEAVVAEDVADGDDVDEHVISMLFVLINNRDDLGSILCGLFDWLLLIFAWLLLELAIVAEYAVAAELVAGLCNCKKKIN